MLDTKPTTKYFNEVTIFKKLINTMEIIAMKGSATLYENGQIGQNLVKELPGILTAEDLVNYKGQAHDMFSRIFRIHTNEFFLPNIM